MPILDKDDQTLHDDVRGNKCPPDIRDEVIAELMSLYKSPHGAIVLGWLHHK